MKKRVPMNVVIYTYVPLPNWEDPSSVWSAAFFHYEANDDQYRCPEGIVLKPIGTVDEHNRRQLYRAPASVCNACPVKSHCTTSNQGRRLYRSIYESYRERVQGYHQTEPYQKAIRKRKVWVEPLFAEAKDWHGLRRFRLRRLWRVNCEALLTASGQNIKRLLQNHQWERSPAPTVAMGVAFLISLF